MTADREVLVESKDSTIVAPEVHQVVFEKRTRSSDRRARR
jgi:hypothetical protein